MPGAVASCPVDGWTLVRVRRMLCVAASSTLAAGCYAYRPADLSGLRSGEAVHVELTPSGAEEITHQLGPRVASLDARVVGPRDSALVLAVRQLTRSRGTEEFWTGDSVTVPVRALSSVSVRRFDRTRTWLAVGASAIGIVVMRQAIIESGIFGGRVNRQPGAQ
jgi:hypothetical protein